jgi:hypothetical protein
MTTIVSETLEHAIGLHQNGDLEKAGKLYR